jgi:hypothetical protein
MVQEDEISKEEHDVGAVYDKNVIDLDNLPEITNDVIENPEENIKQENIFELRWLRRKIFDKHVALMMYELLD